MHGDQERQVTAVVFDGCALLDLAGPADVFRAATLLGAAPRYRLVLASPDGGQVRADCGIGVTVDASIADIARHGGTDTLLIVGGFGVDRFIDDQRSLADLRRISAQARQTASVCTGALVLATAGLLNGYRATTHWASCDRLTNGHPQVSVEPDRIYVHDRDRWTSAGVTAGIDLSLAMVEADCGTQLAHTIARWLVVFVRRPGGQAQFSVQLRGQPAQTSTIAGLQQWLPDNLTEDLSVEALARRAGMSPRNFARVFRAEVGTTPASLVEALRVEAARQLLETSDLVVATVAAKTGFGGPETLHRAFQRRLGTTPDSYRQHFHRSA